MALVGLQQTMASTKFGLCFDVKIGGRIGQAAHRYQKVKPHTTVGRIHPFGATLFGEFYPECPSKLHCPLLDVSRVERFPTPQNLLQSYEFPNTLITTGKILVHDVF